MAAKQLTIFEVEPGIVALDLEKANVQHTNKNIAYTDVVVLLPGKKDYETWEHICYCVWKKLKCEWDEAVSVVEEIHKKTKTIDIRIPINNGKAFFSPNVIQYL